MSAGEIRRQRRSLFARQRGLGGQLGEVGPDRDGRLASIGGVRHGFFTRQGGVSGGIYASLNCGPGSRDDAENVVQNRGRVAELLGAEPGRLLTLFQKHSADVVVAPPVIAPAPVYAPVYPVCPALPPYPYYCR